MKWSSAVSLQSDTGDAVDEAARGVEAALEGRRPDLAIVFVSAHHRDAYESIPDRIREKVAPRILIGCSAGGVIGGGREVEERAGFSLTAAMLPGVELTPLRLAPGAEPSLTLPRLGARGRPHFLLLADPFSFDAEGFLRSLDHAYASSGKVGGLASGAHEPGQNVLYLDREVWRDGLVGVALDGDIEIETIVAQGCRPIGEPMFVTGSKGNVIRGLDGRPTLEALQDLHSRLDARDQRLFRHSLFLGIVMKESREAYRQGDFLIRNIVGLDRDSGALAVGAMVRDGLIVQFHLRDAATSAADLEELLSREARIERPGPEGALLFSCLGRGKHLYGTPDHDTDALRRHLGDVPLGGFFCNGEIGPVHGTTFLHGYTSAFGLFRPRR